MNQPDHPHEAQPTSTARRTRSCDGPFLRLRSRALLQPRFLQGAAGRHRGLARGAPARRGPALLRALRRGDRAVAARCGDHDARGRRDLRPRLGRADRLLRFHDRCDAGFPRRPLRAARRGAGPLRRAPARDQRRHRPGRRLLPVHAATGAALSLLRDQPRDGADADPHPDLLLGEPARHARRHPGVS